MLGAIPWPNQSSSPSEQEKTATRLFLWHSSRSLPLYPPKVSRRVLCTGAHIDGPSGPYSITGASTPHRRVCLCICARQGRTGSKYAPTKTQTEAGNLKIGCGTQRLCDASGVLLSSVEGTKPRARVHQTRDESKILLRCVCPRDCRAIFRFPPIGYAREKQDLETATSAPSSAGSVDASHF